MKCPKCQFINRDGAKFCNECGHRFEIACPDCGAANRSGSKFCDECGQSLSRPAEPAHRDLSFDEKIAKIQRYLPEGLTEKILSQRDRIEGERKQVTVMFCDMEGFTALTEQLGPEEAYSVMDDVYEILIHKVHDYEGTVNEMTGDGIVALFGAPIALEDAPQRAIRSAMAIHREMTRFSDKMRKERAGALPLKMRVGIHTGPVVVGTLGNDLRVDFKAVGDTVNLASRMEDLAAPGTTYVTEETFKLTEGLFRFEALGAKEIKGKEQAVNVFQVIAPSTRRTRFDVSAERGLTPFVGRERELEILLDGFERAKAGRGQAFSIVAEAGLGKSRLLYEFRKAVANEDATFLEGKSLSYSRGIAYHPITDILKSNFDIKEDEGTRQITEKVRQGLKIMDVDETRTLPSLLELLSVEENGVERIEISPEGRKQRTIETIKTIVLKGSEMRPLIIAFEDLHWADKNSEDVLRALLETIPSARVFLIFTYRPEFVHTWAGKSYHSQLTLSRLSNRESLAMANNFLGTEYVDRNLEELILEKTEGIPFFIEEFVRSLKALNIIEEKNNEVHLAKDVQEVTIPSTVQDVIMARVDSLPAGAKEVLQTGAVIDREFSYELIRRITDLPEQELLSRLSGLKDSELLYERGIYPQTTYIFKHALTREVAYNSLLVRRRNEIHGIIGQAIEGLYSARLEEYYELLAYHYVRSEHKAKAVEYLLLANQEAVKANAAAEGKAYFDEAMSLLDTLLDTKEHREQRISLLVKQRHVFEQLLQLPEYHEVLRRYEPLVSTIRNPALEGAFYARLAYCELLHGFLDQSLKTAAKARELCESAGNEQDAVQAQGTAAWAHLMRGNFELVLDIKEKVVPRMDKRFPLLLYVRAMSVASRACVELGRWDDALAEAQKGIEAAQLFADDSQISFAAWTISSVYSDKGDLSQAIEYGELAAEKASTPGYRSWAESSLAWSRCRLGFLDEGIEALAGLVSMHRAARSMLMQLRYTPLLAEAYILAGESSKAKQTCEELFELAKWCEARPFLGSAHRLSGEIALHSDPTQAASHFEQAISIFRELKAENHLALAYSGMGRFYKQQGNTEQAREYLTKALEIFERLGTLIEPDKVREELEELGGR
jgi:class 3 adenylate cyclase/tetratricopeptide (TPR) repeat protein